MQGLFDPVGKAVSAVVPQDIGLPDAGRHLGLSFLHTLSDVKALPGVRAGSERLLIALGGESVRLLGPSRPGGSLPLNSKRGKVRGMSPGARLRQLAFVNSIDRSKVKAVLFVTGSLRGTRYTVQESWEVIERARRKWFARLGRQLGNRRWFALWRKEPHPGNGPNRLMAHLHVLIFFLDAPPHLVREFRPWNDRAWAECVGDPSIERTACSTELIRQWNGVKSYLCKYLAKDQELSDVETGKVWDVVHWELVPINLQVEDVNTDVSKRYRRACRKWQQRKAACWEVQLPADDGGQRWVQLRPYYRGKHLVTVEDLLANARAAGNRVRRRRPRLCYTTDVPIWAEFEEQGTSPVVKRGLEPMGNERHTFYGSRYFIPSADALRLLEHCKRAYLDKLRFEDECAV